MLNTSELEAALSKIEYPGRKDVAAYNAYAEAQRELVEQWKEWLADEYGYNLPEAAQKEVYSFAWEQGHSSGYQEVANWYSEVAEFAERIRNA